MRRADRKISDAHELEEIIQRADVCRIAFANDNIPYIVTMNFGYKNALKRSFYFHCADKGRKLEMIKKNNHVCFELDTDHKIVRAKKSCNWGMSYCSIIGYGDIAVVEDKQERLFGMNSIMDHYGGEGDYLYDDKVFEKTIILRLDVREMTGKRKVMQPT
jgi:nitroimidazol reductase NimA-like FMN-containing flavoprotein (pyridoxamine 5'-phosphate oxidase superfamily)